MKQSNAFIKKVEFSKKFKSSTFQEIGNENNSFQDRRNVFENSNWNMKDLYLNGSCQFLVAEITKVLDENKIIVNKQ